jgi:hypothetical protein
MLGGNMGVKLGWDNEEKTIILVEIDWPYTWDDLAATWQTITDMMRDQPQPVHLIVAGQTRQFPPGSPLSNLRHIMRFEPPNLGLAILVTENRFQAMINTILFKMSPRLNKNGHVVATLDEAYALVAKEGGKLRPPK